MTDQEMRIAIAEAVGIPVNVCMCGNLEESHCIGRNEHTFTPMCDELPDYLNDLNAMHEAEKWLCDHTGYWQWIERIQGGPPLKFSLLHATARQRSEAFLRTIGKWRDG